MAKKLLSIAVKGKSSWWGFNFYGDPKHIETWRNDGLDVVEIENTIPQIIADFGLVKQWCFLQDLFNFKNPFKNKAEKITLLDSDESKEQP